jgi:hemerythrin superfamily protein
MSNYKTVIQTNIAGLRNGGTLSNNDKDVLRILSQFYRNAPTANLQKIPQLKNIKNASRISNYINKQFKELKNHRISTRNGGLVITLNININQLHDFFLFLWLDMCHDFGSGSIGDFDKFLKGPVVSQFASGGNANKWRNWNRTPIETENFKFLREHGMIGKQSSKYAYPTSNSADIGLKEYFGEMWSAPGSPVEPIYIDKNVTEKYFQSIIKDKKTTYISFDSQNAHFLSLLIASSKVENKSGTQSAYLLKRIYTLANLMDPGRLGGASVKAGSSMDEVYSRLFTEEVSWPYKVNAQPFKWNFGDYFTISIEREPKASDFTCKLNDQELKLGITKKQAASENTVIGKLSKTFGDLNQILTVSTLRKNGVRIVSGTQDRAFVGMTGFIQRELFKIQPQIIISPTATGGTRNDSHIILYGMQGYFKSNVKKTKTGGFSINTSQINIGRNTSSSRNRNANNNANAKLAAMLMKQSTPSKPNNAAKSNKNLAQALANSKRLTNKWKLMKRNAVARRNKIRNNFRAVVNAAVKQNKNKKEIERKARENAEKELSRIRVALEEAKKAALNAQKKAENERRAAENAKKKVEKLSRTIGKSKREVAGLDTTLKKTRITRARP